jgi:hypothetical protein
MLQSALSCCFIRPLLQTRLPRQVSPSSSDSPELLVGGLVFFVIAIVIAIAFDHARALRLDYDHDHDHDYD